MIYTKSRDSLVVVFSDGTIVTILPHEELYDIALEGLDGGDGAEAFLRELCVQYDKL